MENLELIVEKMQNDESVSAALLEDSEIFTRIRNRVAKFVRSVEVRVVEQDGGRAIAQPVQQNGAGKIFIGHGHSRVWRDL